VQFLQQQRLGDMALMVLVEHLAAQLRPKVPAVEVPPATR
jgi:hypothetical protein